MNLSKKPTAPKYGFGKAGRDKMQKVYTSKAHSKSQFIGKVSPGPNFEGTDFFEYDKAPGWVFGNDIRNTLDIKQPYDHYNRIDQYSDAILADKMRKLRAETMRIGTAKRFLPGVGEIRGTPGPKYNPNLKPEIMNTEKFSFGYRRDVSGYSALKPPISTGSTVGPGSYHRNNPVGPNTSKQRNQPAHAFPEHLRFVDGCGGVAINETYEIYQSVANQTRSQKRSEPNINFTRSTRAARRGQFKDNLAKPVQKIVIPMPKMK